MEFAATILAALIGAVGGSIGVQYLGDRSIRQRDADRTRRVVAQRHLIQLQDALESLWFRLNNIADSQGRSVMSDSYYQLSSPYAIGIALAQKRRLMMEGAYAAMDAFGPSFTNDLEDQLEQLESAFGGEFDGDTSFYRYERLALADSLLRWDNGWRVLSYAEFRESASAEGSDRILDPARALVGRLGSEQLRVLLAQTASAVLLMSGHTRIRPPTAITAPR